MTTQKLQEALVDLLAEAERRRIHVPTMLRRIAASWPDRQEREGA
jgi:hypothetical protein